MITNLKGSALNYEDVSILNEFKFSENNKNMNNIISKIEIILKTMK